MEKKPKVKKFLVISAPTFITRLLIDEIHVLGRQPMMFFSGETVCPRFNTATAAARTGAVL